MVKQTRLFQVTAFDIAVYILRMEDDETLNNFSKFKLEHLLRPNTDEVEPRLVLTTGAGSCERALRRINANFINAERFAGDVLKLLSTVRASKAEEVEEVIKPKKKSIKMYRGNIVE